MTTAETTRHKLPFLVVAQAQKEITHNEALVRIDALLHPVVTDELNAPPVVVEADIGKCWLVGLAPTGEWAGKEGQLAIWIGGGWRFCEAASGMRIRNQATGADRIRSGANWISAIAIAEPTNGTVVDSEARAAISALLAYLRTTGQLVN